MSDTTELPPETPSDPDRLEPLTGSLTADPGEQILVRDLAGIRAEKKALEAKEKEITAALKGKMIANSAAILLGENGVTIARISMYDKTLVDGKALEVKYPAIFEECSKTNQVIQLRLA